MVFIKKESLFGATHFDIASSLAIDGMSERISTLRSNWAKLVLSFSIRKLDIVVVVVVCCGVTSRC